MEQHREGGCQCGALRYRIRGEPRGLAVCHCTECQRQSGSAFGMSLAVGPSDFEILSGRLRTFEVVCDSGRPKTCAFCPECGVRIHHQGPDGELSIKAGTLDDRSGLRPDAHYWTRRKQAWVEITDGVATSPDDETATRG
ncbi:MAG: GFA family protein [Myxococcota bacterium]